MSKHKLILINIENDYKLFILLLHISNLSNGHVIKCMFSSNFTKAIFFALLPFESLFPRYRSRIYPVTCVSWYNNSWESRQTLHILSFSYIICSWSWFSYCLITQYVSNWRKRYMQFNSVSQFSKHEYFGEDQY